MNFFTQTEIVEKRMFTSRLSREMNKTANCLPKIKRPIRMSQNIQAGKTVLQKHTIIIVILTMYVYVCVRASQRVSSASPSHCAVTPPPPPPLTRIGYLLPRGGVSAKVTCACATLAASGGDPAGALRSSMAMRGAGGEKAGERPALRSRRNLRPPRCTLWGLGVGGGSPGAGEGHCICVYLCVCVCISRNSAL